MLIDFVTLAAFVLVVGAVFFVRKLVRDWRTPLHERLAAESAGGKVPGLVFGGLTDTLAAQLPPLLTSVDGLARDLRRAGYYKPTARQEFLAIRNVLAIGMVIATGVLAVTVGPERKTWMASILIWGMAAAAVAYVLPVVLLRQKGKSRVRLIQRALPDAFDMTTMCLTGGLSLSDSLGNVSREIYHAHPHLAVELEIVRQHADMASLGEAFRHFSERIDAPEIRAWTALVAQTERLGSNMVQAVREFAAGIREKQRQTADERASKAGVKLLFPLVFCLAPAAMIILWGPAVLELRNFFRTFSVESGAAQASPNAPRGP